MATIAFFEMLILQVAYVMLWGQFVLETKIVGCLPFLVGIYATLLVAFPSDYFKEKTIYDTGTSRRKFLNITSLGFVSVSVCLVVWAVFRQVTPKVGAEDWVQIIRGIFILATYLLLLIFAPVTFVLYVRAFLPNLK